MNNKKKKYIMFAIIISIMIAGSITAFAFISNRTEKSNELSIAKQTISMNEPNFHIEPDEILPDNKIVKDPTVTNTGTVPCYIRLFVGCTSFKVNARPIYNEDKWVYEDGYYYLKTPLQPGQSEKLCEEMVLETDEASITDTFDIEIQADSIRNMNPEGTWQSNWLEHNIVVDGE